MVLNYHEEELDVKCKHIIVDDDGTVIDDIFMCFHGERGFLYARNGSVEKFSIPEKSSEPGETG